VIDGVVRNDEARNRYEIRVDDEVVGFISYRTAGHGLAMVHAEVPQEWEGQGVGSMLAAGALDDVRARGLRVRPDCPFVADFIDKHPEYADLKMGS
jgi:predicted GNAT family acetyltransferase